MGQKKKTTKEKTTSKTASGKSLLIVESPAKAKTIKKILGSSFQIKASVGHIRDLPKKTLGVDVKKNYAPAYEVLPEKEKVVKELSEAAQKVDYVYLAPDPDREGEAIAWHIASILEDVPKDKILRVEFNEITKNAIQEAIKHPRDIDMKRVNAQQARRILDRLVGYKLSPLLWSKIQKGLSAGRVQSVAVRIICDREEEIDAFTPVEYWSIATNLSKQKSSVIFPADLTKYKGKKIEINNEEEATKVVDYLKEHKDELEVEKVTTRKSTKNPAPPFITSTLQRDANSKFGFSVKKTMQVAQQLYEGIELGQEGHTGLITYMRTDSTRIADEAAADAKDFIETHFGKEYYPEKPRVYSKKGKNVQDAHEAIRPTYIAKSPEKVKAYLNKDQFRVYKLIWDRFMASQMESAKLNNISNEISAGDYTLKASYSKVIFKGYYIVYQSFEEDEDKEKENEGNSKNIPELKKGDKLTLKDVLPKQHFTQPPPRYSEASLVKALEERGIGRPSTYATIISTIQDRGYVEKIEKSLAPTDLGKLVNKKLLEHFTNIVDTQFTADMEEKLDKVAFEDAVWQDIVSEFYDPFNETLKLAKKNMEKVVIESDVDCPECGKRMVIKVSRWGSKFLACPGYPECKKTMPLSKDEKPLEPDQPSDEKCEKCDSEMVIKHGPYGKYLSCTNEDCKNKKPLVNKIGIPCPKCGDELIERKTRRGKIFYGCQGYPKCDFASWAEPTTEKCPECSSMLTKKELKRSTKYTCINTECSYERAETKDAESSSK